MNVALFLIPLALALGLFFLLCFLWASQAGQYDDLETPAWKILLDEPSAEPATKLTSQDG